MEFKRAGKSDIDDIMRIIEGAQDHFKSQEIDQWQNDYPNAKVIEKDIDNNESYVLKHEGKVIGTAYLSFAGEEDYDVIHDGEWLSHEKYGVIHRMAIDYDLRGTGVAYIFLKAIEGICIDKGIPSIKVDTHRKNIPMQKLLGKNNFEKCGIIYLKDGDERIAYEKIL